MEWLVARYYLVSVEECNKYTVMYVKSRKIEILVAVVGEGYELRLHV